MFDFKDYVESTSVAFPVPQVDFDAKMAEYLDQDGFNAAKYKLEKKIGMRNGKVTFIELLVLSTGEMSQPPSVKQPLLDKWQKYVDARKEESERVPIIYQQ